MIRNTLIIAGLFLFAACNSGSEEPVSKNEVDKPAFITAQLFAACTGDNEPEALCRCLADEIVTDIDPELEDVFYNVIKTDGVEELNKGDWQDNISDELKAKADTHITRVRTACVS